MLATFASALIIVLGSLVVGRALMRALGRRETSWLEPAVGFAALMVVASLSVRLLDGGLGAAIVVGVLIAASLAYLRLRALPAEDLRLAAAPALLAAAVASIPLLGSLRVGILGVGVNNDLASHLLWAEWLRDQNDPQPVSLVDGYPVGPHSVAASLGEAFGFAMTEAVMGLLIAVAALTALTALALLRDLPPLRRTVAAALVALPYMAASALAVGGFKEMTMGLVLFGFVIGLVLLEREYPGDLALLASLGVFAAAATAVYSYPGLYWLLAAAGLLALAGLVRFARQRGGLEGALRGAGRVVGIPVAVLAVVGFAELWRANTFRQDSPVGSVIEGDGKLRDQVSPLEGLGAWPDSSFLAGTSDLASWPLFGLLGLAALALALPFWLRRGSLAVPLGVLGAAILYLATVATAGLYVQSKALAVPAALVMLLIVRGLLSPDPGGGAASGPARGDEHSAWPSRLRWARMAVAVAFLTAAAYSSFLALRDAVVAPNEHGDELATIRELVPGEWTLSLTTDRFTDYQLRGTMVGSPDRNSQLTVPARPGKDFRLPLDFDSVAPETLDYFRWVLVTGAPYRSQPPPNLRLVESTDSYELWERAGPTPLITRVFGEQARPGKVLRCRAEDLEVAQRRKIATDATVIVPAPTIGKRSEWSPSNELAPGESATQTLRLPPGDWLLSMQYQSPVKGLTVEAGDESFELPAAMDGAIPFRRGQGPFWPVGELDSAGGDVEITVRVNGLGAVQRLLGVDAEAAIGNIVATRPEPYRRIPFGRACGRYVDHYEIRPQSLSDRERRISERVGELTEIALTGRYRPLTPEEIAEKRRLARERAAEGG